MSNVRTCPKCGAPAPGNFCGECGASMKTRHCTQCGAPLTPGARFCTQCGASTAPQAADGGGSKAASGRTAAAGGGRSGGGDSQVGWWVAGGMMIVLITVFAWPILRPEDVAPVPQVQAPAPTGAGAVDLTSMTPLEAAIRLFNRVMTAAEAGDSTQARQFIPMAIQAYEIATPLPTVGIFHLSTLQRITGDFATARATAEGGLVDDPDHLLLLYAAAEAAREAGDTDSARGYYQMIVDKYDAEVASGLTDYTEHRNMMPSVRSDATAFLAGGG